MPKVVVTRKVTTIRGAPADTAVKTKMTNRARTKNGRATSAHLKTTLNVLEPDPTPTQSALPDLYPENPPSDNESDGEREVLANTGPHKASGKAVSVSPNFSCVP